MKMNSLVHALIVVSIHLSLIIVEILSLVPPRNMGIGAMKMPKKNIKKSMGYGPVCPFI
jgi:hypothetical protein